MEASGHALARLLLAASRAVKVVAMPVRHDGTAPREYGSSGPTFANRIRADPASILSVAWEESPASAVAPHCCSVRVKAGGVRQTVYRLWLDDAPGQIDVILADREAAAKLRASLPHSQRRRKPWGPL